VKAVFHFIVIASRLLHSKQAFEAITEVITYGVARTRECCKAVVISSFRSASNNRAGLYRDPKQKVFIVKKKRSDLKAKKTRYYNH